MTCLKKCTKAYPEANWLIVAMTIGLLNACSATGQHMQRQELEDLGSFQFRPPQSSMDGVIIGVPHGSSEQGAAAMARSISDRTGAGFVAAYGFKSKRISVAQPLERTGPFSSVPRDPAKRGSVFREFKDILRQVSHGRIDLYVEIRSRPVNEGIERIQVVASGFTFEEVKIIKQDYSNICASVIGKKIIQKLPIAIDPVDKIAWQPWSLKHHGVLMIAEKAVSVRLPSNFLSEANLDVYSEVFAAWINQLRDLVRQKPWSIPHVEVTLMDLGRFDLISGQRVRGGIVIGAPHGSYDEHTAEVVTEISHRTGLAAVVSRGFTPTEAGGWRINVNRPTEKTYWAPEFEVSTERAQKIYEKYNQLVFKAAQGILTLYFDVHQYGTADIIQVATVGVSVDQATNIKREYLRIRDKILRVGSNSNVERVDLVIEPLDAVEIGAWPAKASGILSVAKRGLHFELPLRTLLRTQKSRDTYSQILAELLTYCTKLAISIAAS